MPAPSEMPAPSKFRPGRRYRTRWVAKDGAGVGHLLVRLACLAGTFVLTGGLLEWAGTAPAWADPSCSGTTTITCEFFYTGAPQSFTVPSNVTQVTIDAVGAAGGVGADGTPGGLGGEAVAMVSVTPNETLQVNVGGDGQPGSTTGPGSGGFNDGGPGGTGINNFNGGGSGGGGGGASDVRQGGTGLGNRIVVAGGGGGGGIGSCPPGGTGGGLSGGISAICINLGDLCIGGTDAQNGGPGTQTAGGSADTADGATPGTSGAGGSGGNGTANLLSLFASAGGGGGGGGYYGGGGGGGNNTGLFCPVASGAGGGGSGFTPSGTGMTNGVHAAVPVGAPTGGGDVSISYAAQASTTTSVSSSANPSSFGQQVTFTATVTPTDGGGTVAFYADSSATPISGCGAQSLTQVTGSSYSATCSTSALPVGAHTISATYSGDSSFAGSSGSLAGDQTVNQAATAIALSSSQNPSVFGQRVTFTATVSPVAPGAGTPTASVTFLVDGKTVAIVCCGGGAFSTPLLGAGSHIITASYSGDSNFTGSTGSVTQMVKQVPTTTSLSSSQDPSALGAQVTYTATISPAPDGGTVTFTDGGTAITGCGSQPAGSGTATCTLTYTAPGSHTIAASYSGDANFTASTSPPLGQTVAQCGTTLSACNLSGANLSGANLSGQNLSGTNFKTANLSGANLSNANLSGANLSGATLTGASLSGANLSGANLKGANLSNADLTNANLTGANLSGANLTGATLNGVTWLNTVCPDGTNSNNDGGTCVGHL